MVGIVIQIIWESLRRYTRLWSKSMHRDIPSTSTGHELPDKASDSFRGKYSRYALSHSLKLARWRLVRVQPDLQPYCTYPRHLCENILLLS